MVVCEFVSVPVIVSPVFVTFPVICVCIELVAPFTYDNSVSDGYVEVESEPIVLLSIQYTISFGVRVPSISVSILS